MKDCKRFVLHSFSLFFSKLVRCNKLGLVGSDVQRLTSATTEDGKTTTFHVSLENWVPSDLRGTNHNLYDKYLHTAGSRAFTIQDRLAMPSMTSQISKSTLYSKGATTRPGICYELLLTHYCYEHLNECCIYDWAVAHLVVGIQTGAECFTTV